MNGFFSRRRFFHTVAAAMACSARNRFVTAASGGDIIQLGMMLQGNSTAELQTRAKAIVDAGFKRVQLSFFFDPSSDELVSLARLLKELQLRTVAFGTYFNQFRPDDTTFMGASLAVMRKIASCADLFQCNQFVTWSGSFAAEFGGSDPRNHTAEAVERLQGCIATSIVPILEPIAGRVAFEPYFPHVLGTAELAKQVLAPFPARQVGLLLDPPNFVNASLYPRRDAELQRLFRELGDRVHLAHFKDLKLNANGQTVDLPGPGAGEMNYPLFLSEIRKLERPLNCIIEHIPAEVAAMKRAKEWIEKVP